MSLNKPFEIRRFLRFPAGPFIFICMVAWLACILIATNGILNSPYFGAVFATNNGQPGIVVKSVEAGSPAASAGLSEGAVILRLGSPGSGVSLILSNVAGVHDRSEINTFEAWTRTIEDRAAIRELMETGELLLDLENNRQLRLSLSAGRSWSSLPVWFWTGAVHSLAVLLISAGLAVFAPSSHLIKLLFLSGFWLSTNILTHAFRACEELVFPLGISNLLYIMGNLSAVLFTYTLLAMLWHTPHRMSRFPFAIFAIGFAVFAFLAQHFQWFSFPIHPFQFPYLFAILIAVAMMAVKWVASRSHPLDRATLSWVLFSIFAAVIPWLVVFSIPIVLGTGALLNPNLSGLILTLVYIGFALGALKFRLFQIRAIWLRSMVWLSIGIGMVLLDLVLLTQFNWSQLQAIPTAVMLASWGYFPIKNLIINRLASRNSILLADANKKLFDRLASIPEPAEFNGRFIGFMKELFQARDVEIHHGEKIEHVTIQENGLSLGIPAMAAGDTFILSGRNNGQTLFSYEDRKIAGTLSELARGIQEQQSSEFIKRESERIQIARDLHDDVGAKLLNLIYTTPDKSKVRTIAEQAMKALKDSLMTIENTEDLNPETNWTQFWSEQEERLKSTGFETDFQTKFIGTRIIKARDLVNMKRIFEEHISNIIKYASRDAPVEGVAQIQKNGDFVIEIYSGIDLEKSSIKSNGRGLANIIMRAKESSAEILIGVDETDSDRFRFYFRLPLADW